MFAQGSPLIFAFLTANSSQENKFLWSFPKVKHKLSLIFLSCWVTTDKFHHSSRIVMYFILNNITNTEKHKHLYKICPAARMEILPPAQMVIAADVQRNYNGLYWMWMCRSVQQARGNSDMKIPQIPPQVQYQLSWIPIDIERSPYDDAVYFHTKSPRVLLCRLHLMIQ